jgi:4-hydroxy-tetrahydrodipicolinate synthase
MPHGAHARTDAIIGATVRLAEDARRGGADAVLVHAPTGFRGLQDVEARVVTLHQAVADVGLPVIAFYLYEAAGGITYSLQTVEHVLEIDGVIGMKVATLDSVMTYQDLVPVVEHAPEVLLITGEDRFVGYSLMLGAQCALVGIAAACTELSVSVLDAWFSHDLTAFVQHTAVLDMFARATFTAPMDGYVQRMLWALAADGIMPDARDPFAPPLDADERDRVTAAVREVHAT